MYPVYKFNIGRNVSPAASGVTVTEISLPASDPSPLQRLKTSTLGAHDIHLYGYSHSSDGTGVYWYEVWLAAPGISTTSALWADQAVCVDVVDPDDGRLDERHRLYEDDGTRTRVVSDITPASTKVVTVTSSPTVLQLSDRPAEPVAPFHTTLGAVLIGTAAVPVYPVWSLPKIRIPSGLQLAARGLPEMELSLYVLGRRLAGSSLATTAFAKVSPAVGEDVGLVDVVNTVDIATAVPLPVTATGPLPVTLLHGDVQERVVVTSEGADGKASALWVITDSNMPY